VPSAFKKGDGSYQSTNRSAEQMLGLNSSSNSNSNNNNNNSARVNSGSAVCVACNKAIEASVVQAFNGTWHPDWLVSFFFIIIF
jgi:hypothetical protein